MIGLLARIALFVVVDVPLLRVFFRVEIEDQVNTWSSIFFNTEEDYEEWNTNHNEKCDSDM